MLKLRLNNTASAWLDLGNGVRVQVPPSNTAALRAAEFAAFRALAAAREAMELTGRDVTEQDAVGEMEGVFAQARCRALAARIEAWEGIGDEDGGALEITPEALDAFAAHPALGGPFVRRYDEASLEMTTEAGNSVPSGAGKRQGAKRTASAAAAAVPPAPAS